MKDGRLFLKVKIKCLAAEARIIKRETAKAPVPMKDGLARHRIDLVRPAARSTLLAYGFLRGRAYLQLESDAGTKPNQAEVARMVEKYGRRWDVDTETYAQYQADLVLQASRLRDWFKPLAVAV